MQDLALGGPAVQEEQAGPRVERAQVLGFDQAESAGDPLLQLVGRRLGDGIAGEEIVDRALPGLGIQGEQLGAPLRRSAAGRGRPGRTPAPAPARGSGRRAPDWPDREAWPGRRRAQRARQRETAPTEEPAAIHRANHELHGRCQYRKPVGWRRPGAGGRRKPKSQPTISAHRQPCPGALRRPPTVAARGRDPPGAEQRRQADGAEAGGTIHRGDLLDRSTRLCQPWPAGAV